MGKIDDEALLQLRDALQKMLGHPHSPTTPRKVTSTKEPQMASTPDVQQQEPSEDDTKFQKLVVTLHEAMDAYLKEEIVIKKLQKADWKDVLPIHELLEVKASMKSASRRNEEERRFPFLELLKYVEKPDTRKRLVIVSGLPGIGKTACAAQLVHHLITTNQDKKEDDEEKDEQTRTTPPHSSHEPIIVPLYLELGQQHARDALSLALPLETSPFQKFLQVAHHVLSSVHPNVTSETPRCDTPSFIHWVLFIDGWNEAPPDYRKKILPLLLEQAHSDPSRAMTITMFIFTRPGSLPRDLADRTDVVTVEMLPLRTEQAMTLVKHAARSHHETLKAANVIELEDFPDTLIDEFAERMARHLVKSLEEFSNASSSLLLPFFLIPLATFSLETWISRRIEKSDSLVARSIGDEEVKLLLDPLFKSKTHFIQIIWEALLRRNMYENLVMPLATKIMSALKSRLENLEPNDVAQLEPAILSKLWNMIKSRHDHLAALLVHELYLSLAPNKGTWFSMRHINDAFSKVQSMKVLNDEESLALNTRQLLRLHLTTTPDSSESSLSSKHSPTNRESPTFSPSDHAILLAEITTDESSSIPLLAASINFKELLHHVLFPRIHRHFKLSTFEEPQMNEASTFVTTIMRRTTSSTQAHLHTITQTQWEEEREVLHELIADYLLAKGILFTWETFIKSKQHQVIPSMQYLQWMENDQFDETWQQVFTSPPLDDDIQKISPFLETILVKALSRDDAEKHVNALKSIVELFRVAGHARFTYDGHEWEQVERSFRLRLSPRGIKHVQLSAIIGKISDAKDRERILEELTSQHWQHLDSLRGLDLSLNQLRSLPESFGYLTNLQVLSLAGNQLRSLPESFGTMTNLQQLSLSGNWLRSLPESILRLSNLQYLDLSWNQLRSLPESFGQLHHLQELWLYENQLYSLPESFGQLTYLQKLSLRCNQLRSLPESFGQLTYLQHLDLEKNQLRSLPESFGQLHHLQELWLNDNQLRSLPESFGRLTNLQQLNLSGNRLNSLPESFGRLTNLQQLNLSGNQLRALPESFNQLRNLQVLGLESNQLSSLPKSIPRLSNLQWLSLSGNQLRALPESFGRLTNLQKLWLYENQLRALPESITNLTNLTYIDLSGNPSLRLSRERERWLNDLKMKGCTVLRG